MSDPRFSGGVPPAIQGGPATAQFLGAFQQMEQTFNAILLALQQMVGIRPASQIALSEIAAPAAPASGAILYVDSTTHLLMAVDSVGNRVALT